MFYLWTEFFLGLLNNLSPRETNLYLNSERIVGYRYYPMFGLISDIITTSSLESSDIIVLFFISDKEKSITLAKFNMAQPSPSPNYWIQIQMN